MKTMRIVMISVCVMCCFGWTLRVLAAKYDPLVEQAQKRLTELGYDVGTPDGKIGQKTVAAIKKFQQAQGLTVTGQLDEATMLKFGLIQVDPNNDLLTGVKNCHLQDVRKAIENGADVNVANTSGMTALILASSKGCAEIVQLLLEYYGIEVNAQAQGGFTALMHAAYSGHTEIVKLLLEHGADPGMQTDDGRTAVSMATKKKHIEIVHMLQKPVSPTTAKKTQSTDDTDTKEEALIEAVSKGDIEAVKLLIDAGADINAQAKVNKYTALMRSAIKGDTEVIQLLIDAGANVNAQGDSGETALMEASFNGNTETIKLLIDAGADVNAEDEDGDTALILAAMAGHTEVVKLLIDAGADVNAENEGGETALTTATKYQIVKLLIDANADVNTQSDEFGFTALMEAAGHGDIETMKLLIDVGADVNIRDENGFTALMHAIMYATAEFGDTEAVKLLIDAGADINVQGSKSGRTALMNAARYGHQKIVKLLIDAGVDVDAKQKNGWTAMTFAEFNGHAETVQMLKVAADLQKTVPSAVTMRVHATPNNDLLAAITHCQIDDARQALENGADVNTTNTSGMTSLILASSKGCTEVVAFLLESHAEVNAQAQGGFTALMHAAYNGHAEIVKLLLAHGADPDMQTDDGRTAVSLATKKKHTKIVQNMLRSPLSFSTKDAEVFYNQGNDYLKKGEYDRAIESYTQAIRLNPTYAWAYYTRGMAYAQSPMYEIDPALEHYTGLVPVKETGNVDRAIADYTQAISLNPNFAEAYYYRGLAYAKKEETEQATDDFKKAWDDFTKACNLGYTDACKKVQLPEDLQKASPSSSLALPVGLKKVAIGKAFNNEEDCDITEPLLNFPAGTTQFAFQVMFDPETIDRIDKDIFIGGEGFKKNGGFMQSECNKYTLRSGEKIQYQWGATISASKGSLKSGAYILSVTVNGKMVKIPFEIE